MRGGGGLTGALGCVGVALLAAANRAVGQQVTFTCSSQERVQQYEPLDLVWTAVVTGPQEVSADFEKNVFEFERWDEAERAWQPIDYAFVRSSTWPVDWQPGLYSHGVRILSPAIIAVPGKYRFKKDVAFLELTEVDQNWTHVEVVAHASNATAFGREGPLRDAYGWLKFVLLQVHNLANVHALVPNSKPRHVAHAARRAERAADCLLTESLSERVLDMARLAKSWALVVSAMNTRDPVDPEMIGEARTHLQAVDPTRYPGPFGNVGADALGLLVLCDALLGDRAGAERTAARLRKRFPRAPATKTIEKHLEYAPR